MWKIVIQAVKFGATTLAGWAISDWFNEKQRTKQAEAEKPTAAIISDSLLKWVLVFIGVITAYIALNMYKSKHK